MGAQRKTTLRVHSAERRLTSSKGPSADSRQRPPITWPAPGIWLAVAGGALLGSELRYIVGLLWSDLPGQIPWATLMINVTGSFVLAALTTFWIATPTVPLWLRAGVGPGLLGSFTTFSAVVYAADQLTRTGYFPVAVLYLAGSVILGLAAAGAGWSLGKRWGTRQRSSERAC